MARKKTPLLLLLAMALATFIATFGCRGATDEVVAFGLTNRSINSAAIFLEPDYPELRVTNLSDLGYKGVSVNLGQVDSGLFFSPYTRAYLENQNFMIGHAYGRSAGIERRLVSVYCERTDWATFPVTVDFLPLGAIAKTVQIFVGRVLVGEETYTNGTVVISTSNSGNVGPRINPYWPMPDGSVGVLLEFTETPPITLPSGRVTYANRIFIRAEHPLFPVDYVSRVDVYGGGGLPEFSVIDERLGMFGLPHRALGGAVFTATTGQLTIARCMDAGTDGVLVELEDSSAFTAEFQPISLAGDGARFQASATATSDYYSHYGPGSYFGPLGIENIVGEKKLRVDAPGTNSWQTRVEMLDGALSTGEFIFTNSGYAGSFGTNNLEVLSAGVVGGIDVQPAVLFLRFREPATLTIGSLVLRGDSVRISPLGVTNDIGTFVSFHLLACGVPPIAITNETVSAPPPFALAIERAGTNVLVSWPAYASRYSYVETREAFSPGASWHYVDGESLPSIRSRIRTRYPFNLTGEGYFRLRNFYVQDPEPIKPE